MRCSWLSIGCFGAVVAVTSPATEAFVRPGALTPDSLSAVVVGKVEVFSAEAPNDFAIGFLWPNQINSTINIARIAVNHSNERLIFIYSI